MTTYYVSNDGDNSNTGLSDAQAWETIGKVNGFSFSTSDDVYFKCDDTWTEEQLGIDWSGTSGNRAVIGAYYMDAGSEVIGVSGNKPIFAGNDAAPGATNDGLIEINNRDYVTLENIKVIDSTGYGVDVTETVGGKGQYIYVQNMYISGCYNSAIRYYKTDYGLIDGNEITDCGNDDGGNHPAIIALVQGTNNATVGNNKIYDVIGEAIGIFKGLGADCIIEKNVIWDTRNGTNSIYVDGNSGTIIRYNLVYNDDNGHTGIGINNEKNTSPVFLDSEIYGNLLASCSNGIKINTHTDHDGTAYIRNVKIYNNTIVEPADYCIRSAASASQFDSAEIKNNIFLFGNEDAGDAADLPAGADIVFSNNNWYSDPGAPYKDVATDVIGDPKLSKSSGWTALAGGTITGSEFELQASSPCIDVGVDLGASYDDALEPGNVDFTASPIDVNLVDQDDY